MENVNKQLFDALKALFASYKQLADSGDAGNWRIEDYPEGKQALQAISAAEQAQRPCQYCNGTGDVHSIAGEWRGVCSCEAGRAQQAEPVWPSLTPDVVSALVGNDGGRVVLSEPMEPAATVNDHYSRDGFNDEISSFLPVGTQLYTASQLEDLRSVLAYERAKYDVLFACHFDALAQPPAQPPAVAVLQAELDEWRKLRDPKVLHVNLCRGFPAKLTAEQLLHIAGDEKQSAVGVPELRQVRRAQDGMPSANYAEGFDHGWNDCVYQMRAMFAAAPQAADTLPAEITPAMMRAVQLRSELGAYAAANLAGAYDLFAEFWRVAVDEAKKGGE